MSDESQIMKKIQNFSYVDGNYWIAFYGSELAFIGSLRRCDNKNKWNVVEGFWSETSAYWFNNFEMRIFNTEREYLWYATGKDASQTPIIKEYPGDINQTDAFTRKVSHQMWGHEIKGTDKERFLVDRNGMQIQITDPKLNSPLILDLCYFYIKDTDTGLPVLADYRYLNIRGAQNAVAEK